MNKYSIFVQYCLMPQRIQCAYLLMLAYSSICLSIHVWWTVQYSCCLGIQTVPESTCVGCYPAEHSSRPQRWEQTVIKVTDTLNDGAGLAVIDAPSTLSSENLVIQR